MSIDKIIERDQWTLWKRVKREGRETKVPVGVNQRALSITNPKCFRNFYDVYKIYNDNQDLFDGIGFIVTDDDPFVVIDLDGCNRWNGWQEIIKRLNSYTELSPSKTGFHIIVEGSTPGEKSSFKIGSHDEGGIEIYDDKRYITMSINPIDQYQEIRKNQEGLDWLVETCNDHKVFEMISKRDYSEKVHKLYTGQWSTMYASQSEAELALCRILGNIGCPMHQIDRIFRKSKLMRPKWNEKRGKTTYGRMTLETALKER